MKTHTEISRSEPIITMSRRYAAPRELVWKVITEPRHVTRWWGGAGCINPVCEMDVRPGGAWRHVMRLPNGHEMAMSFVFVKVEQPHLLQWQHANAGGPSGPPEVLFSVTLEEEGGSTLWKLVARYASFRERDASVEMGFTGPIAASNELLATYLEDLQ